MVVKSQGVGNGGVFSREDEEGQGELALQAIRNSSELSVDSRGHHASQRGTDREPGLPLGTAGLETAYLIVA